jgi:small subunit ribosomal protein S9
MTATASATYATGKRKTAIARCWVKAGTGAITVNGKPADEYFERETSRMIMRQSLEIIEAIEQFDVTATVHGGGHSAQAEAMRHGISRALCTHRPREARRVDSSRSAPASSRATRGRRSARSTVSRGASSASASSTRSARI